MHCLVLLRQKRSRSHVGCRKHDVGEIARAFESLRLPIHGLLTELLFLNNTCQPAIPLKPNDTNNHTPQWLPPSSAQAPCAPPSALRPPCAPPLAAPPSPAARPLCPTCLVRLIAVDSDQGIVSMLTTLPQTTTARSSPPSAARSWSCTTPSTTTPT